MQFGLLIMRTLLTVRATKLNTYYLTKAISQASWKCAPTPAPESHNPS